MTKKKPSPEDFYQKLMQATNATGHAHFNAEQPQEVKVDIRPDTAVALGMFKPDPLKPSHYKAHPTTIKAMRKDIFVGGEDGFIDLEKPYTCQNCKAELDLQFWTFCPYCEASFPQDLEVL